MDKKYKIVFHGDEMSWLVATDISHEECVELIQKQIEPKRYEIIEMIEIKEKKTIKKFDEKAFGKRLKGLRELKNVSKEEIAEKLKITEEEYVKVENGECDEDLDSRILFILCQLYEVPADYLIGRLEDMINTEIDISKNYLMVKLLYTTGALRSENIDVLMMIKEVLEEQQKKENNQSVDEYGKLAKETECVKKTNRKI